MADPKARAKVAQDAAAEARAAAKEAAVAAAKAEARAESQAGASASGPIVGSTAGLAPAGIAANVPLDVFAQRSAQRTVARQAEANAPDLSESQQRMADSLGRGRVDTANLRDIGATETPAFVSEQRAGANRKAPGDFEDNPLGDRHAALRDDPSVEADAPMDFGETPLDAAGALGDRGDSLREVAGQGGGLQGVADQLHAMPQSGQGRPGGKEMISEDKNLAAALQDAAAKIPESTDWANVGPDGGTPGGSTPDGGSPGTPDGGTPDAGPKPASYTITDGFQTGTTDFAKEYPTVAKFLKLFTGDADNTGAALRQAVTEIDSTGGSATTPDAGTPDAGGGVTDPGGSEDQTWKPPPGWIDGDAILPPGLRTGAAIGGAKGNDGIDWAHSRAAATTPGPEDNGGGGRPSAGQVWRQKQTNESLVGQPGEDARESGGGGGVSADERRKWATTPDPEDSAADGIGLGGDPAEVNTDPSQNDLSGIDRSGGSDTESRYPTLTISVSRHTDDNDD